MSQQPLLPCRRVFLGAAAPGVAHDRIAGTYIDAVGYVHGILADLMGPVFDDGEQGNA